MLPGSSERRWKPALSPSLVGYKKHKACQGPGPLERHSSSPSSQAHDRSISHSDSNSEAGTASEGLSLETEDFYLIWVIHTVAQVSSLALSLGHELWNQRQTPKTSQFPGPTPVSSACLSLWRLWTSLLGLTCKQRCAMIPSASSQKASCPL